MKKKFCTLVLMLIISSVLMGCESAQGVSIKSVFVNEETKNIEVPVSKDDFTILNTPDLNVIETSEVVDKKIVINDVYSLVEFIERELDCNVSIYNYAENYFNGFMYEQVDESADIAIKNDEFYPFYMSVFFRDSKLFNIVLTYNKLDSDNGIYFGFIEKLYNIMGSNADMTNIDIEQMTSDLMDFSKYSENVYGNPEYSGSFDNVNCLGVVFAEGKDFVFDGSTYYFSFYVSDYFVENEGI